MFRKALTFLVLIGILLIPVGSERHGSQVAALGDEPPMTAQGPFGSSYEAPTSQSQDMSGIVVTEVEGEYIDETLLPPSQMWQSEVEGAIIFEQDIQSELSLSTQSGSDRELTGQERSFSMGVLDNFNRSDGSLGSWWTLRKGSCSISGNHAFCGDNPGVATFNGGSPDGNAAEMDVQVNGTDVQYAALIMNYSGGSSNLFIKVQQQEPYTGFNYAACYIGTGGPGGFPSFGLGFFPLTSPFNTAHMRVIRTDDTVTIKFTRVDFGAQPDQTYICTGAPSPEGTGIGIGAYANLAQMDNFSIPEGPRVLLLEADYDMEGSSDIQTALEGYGDLSDVDLFDAQNGTPPLALLQSYDVVITWSNYSYADSTALGNVLADYVDSGGKVINTMFSMGADAIPLTGRFMAEGYTAVNGPFVSLDTACLGSYTSSHPIMIGITDICDYYRLTGTYLTDGSTSIAHWNDGEIFVGVKNNRSVISITGYIGLDHVWTGQMVDLVHNSIYWLFSGNKILWNQPLSVDQPSVFYFNQYTNNNLDFATFVADDIILTGPWQIKSIFIPGGWFSDANLADAHEIVFQVYENVSGVPAGDPTGRGDPPVWEVVLPINNLNLTIFSGEYDATTNILLNLPAPLELTSGHYWLVVFPVMDFSEFGQLGRAVADTTNGITAQWVNPGNIFGLGTDWQNFSIVGATKYDLAFRIEGESHTVFMPLVVK